MNVCTIYEIRFGVQNECCMYYEICFGVQNECLYDIWNMIWCAKCMSYEICFGVQNECCMYYEICFGVQNVCCTLYEICFGVQNECCMYYEICFGVLSWTRQHECPDIVTCSNRSNCNWKWAFVLTLYNTIARKSYACTSSDPRLPSVPATYKPTQGGVGPLRGEDGILIQINKQCSMVTILETILACCDSCLYHCWCNALSF